MKSIKRIGVYLPHFEPTDPAVERARSLASETGAQISLLVGSWSIESEEVLTEHLQDAHVVELPSTKPSAVRAAVMAEDIDILLKTARPLPGSGKIVGGLARDLLRECPCPLWIVRRAHSKNDAPVIAAIPHLDRDAAALARQVIQTAARIATSESRPLVVAHSPLERALGQLLPRERRLYLTERRRWRLNKLTKLIRAHSPIKANTTPVLLEGDVSSALTRLAAERSSETIVVGHRGRRGISAFLFGNDGERLIEDTRTNVLSVLAA